MSVTETTIRVECPDCHWSGDVPAEIVEETAYWVCPSTWCDRNLIDPAKMTDWPFGWSQDARDDLNRDSL